MIQLPPARTRLPLVLVALLAGSEVCPGLAAAVPEGVLAAGDAALDRFDLPGAVTSYRAAREAAPGSYEAAWKLARALADQATLTDDTRRAAALGEEAAGLARAAVRLEP